MVSEIGKKQTCKRCEHSWNSRVPDKPKSCPNCKSPYWDKDYVTQKKGDRK